jgi:hypothetical protein
MQSRHSVFYLQPSGNVAGSISVLRARHKVADTIAAVRESNRRD